MSMDDRLRLPVDSLGTSGPAALAARRPHPDHRFTHTHRRDLPTPSSPHMQLDLFFFQKPSRKRLPTDNPAGAIQEGNPLHTLQKLRDSNA